ncbi:hypothetical protein V6N11_032986 [Hibiscus sabdariffa]|uniref:Uncharacterized protein n=2 Tax=Hibiscus sabdariffa TaxID=183260 RepID=A0ABR2D065_9ROSI
MVSGSLSSGAIILSNWRNVPLVRSSESFTSLLWYDRLDEYLTIPIPDWVHINLQNPLYFSFSDPDWDILFGAFLWNLWLFRKRKIFDLDNEESDTVFGCSRRLKVATCRSLDIRIQQQSVGGGVRPRRNDWSPPPVGCLKINVDGTRRVVDGVASCGGVIRDSNGIWVDGFSKFIGRCSVLEAEFWAVFEGLCCAKSFNVSKVVVESDNRDVIDV